MRVLFLSPGNLPSKWAHTFQVMKMAEALAAQVERLELVTARSLLPSRVNRVDLHRWYGVSPQLRIVRLPVHGRLRGECFTHDASPRFDRAAVWYARLRRPDLVYSRSIPAAERCAASGLATILESHIPVAHPQFALLRTAAAQPALRRLVTVTEPLREEWIAAGVPAAKIVVWPDAVDLARFEHSPSDSVARDALGLPREGALAVYCGHFYDEKGVPTLVDAARLLDKASVQLVGGWPADIERMRERARGCETLRFTGFVENARVPLHLAAADVLVLPNSGRFPQARTTSPLKLFEYMAARRPIVATRIPALAGVLRHSENAWLVAPDSPEALAEGIESVLASPALAERLAEQAWRDVQNYTWTRRAAEILASLDGVDAAPARAIGAPSAAPRVSVLLPVYDAERYLDEAVESILAQTFSDFELLAIDDGSSDASLAKLEAWARRDARVRVVSRAHAGLVATLNAGLALARGELVARMDADDVALPRRLELQIARLDLDPDLVCVGGAYEVIDARGRRIDFVRPPEAPEQILNAALEGRSPICHPAALYRRARVIGVGGYDVEVPVAQDYDLWLRLMDVGRLANLSEPVLRLRYHARSVSEREQEKQMAYARRICEAARRRRGLTEPLPATPAWRPLPDRLSQQRFALGICRSAWRLGERRTALLYGARAALLQPFSAQLLRLVGHELRRRLCRRGRAV